jgi:poly(A) polymerase
MVDIFAALAAAGIACMEYGVTAIDAYRGHSMGAPIKFILVEGSIVDLAKIFEGLQYPSLSYSDAALGARDAGAEVRFLCVDRLDEATAEFSPYTNFRRNPIDGHFHDPSGIYQKLKSGVFACGTNISENVKYENAKCESPNSENALFETAVYLSRFSPIEGENFPGFRIPEKPSALWQRDLLSLILQAPETGRALEFLKENGFVQAFWPDLDALLLVDHAKECHPEGGGWSHTMEALGYRKSRDLTLSLAILLHDIGKPHSEASEGRKFDKHAEIGAGIAARFLRSLGFSEKIVEDVHFLIRWHMLPAALPRIPASTVADIVLDRRFVELLELYRCDEFSTFKGPDAYYAACAAYRSIMKNLKNPYRDANGRKKSQTCSSAAMWA